MWINPLLSRACVLASFSVCVDVPVVICYSLSYIYCVPIGKWLARVRIRIWGLEIANVVSSCRTSFC